MRIVIVNGGLQGQINASLGLIERLLALGHSVSFACPGRQDLAAHLRRVGAEYVALPPWEPHFTQRKAGAWPSRIATRSTRRAAAVAELGTDAVVDVISARSPDLVLIEIEMVEHILAARAAGLPIAGLCGFQSIWRRPGLPPMGSQVIPGRGPWGTPAGLAALWHWQGLSTRALVLAQRLRNGGVDRRAVLAAHARAHGSSPPVEYGRSNSLLPVDLGPLPVLCLTARELDFPHAAAPHLHFAGPMVRQTELFAGVSAADEARIASLRAPRERRLIYVGSSTLAQGEPAFLRQLIDVARQRPNWDIVMGLGAQEGWQQPSAIPSNLHLLAYAPQVALLQQADCAVLGAGINSIYEGLWHAVPMLVQSLGVNDQNGNAARLRYHDLAHVRPRAQDHASDMITALEQLLADQGLKSRLAEFQAHLKAYPPRLPSILERIAAFGAGVPDRSM